MLFLHWHVLWTCNTQFLKIHPKTWWPLVVKMEATCFSLFFIRYYLDYHGHKCYHGSQLTTILNGKPLWPQDAYKLCTQKKALSVWYKLLLSCCTFCQSISAYPSDATLFSLLDNFKNYLSLLHIWHTSQQKNKHCNYRSWEKNINQWQREVECNDRVENLGSIGN